jgi:thiamine kinase-like enzyme
VITGDRELWEQLLESGRRHFPDVVDDHVYRGCRGLLDAIDDWYPARDALPRTLVHDDLNPRNSCFRADGRPLVYDWELAMLDVPQRDLAELLTFVLDPASASDKALVAYLVERHRRHLVQAAHTELDPEAWWEGFRIAVRLEAINRVPFQWLFATAIELGYVERITRTVQALVRLS